jgi:Gas vesicle protein
MEQRSLQTRPQSTLPGRPEQTNLADILERVLDKGIVIAGDIQINLLDIELLTIKLRLLIASVDRAREMGINWWETDPSLQSHGAGDESERGQLERQNRELRERLERLERQLGVGDGESPESSQKGSSQKKTRASGG